MSYDNNKWRTNMHLSYIMLFIIFFTLLVIRDNAVLAVYNVVCTFNHNIIISKENVGLRKC